MRSTKNRSRGNKNRNRNTGGNIINRVFDSSGPDGKVRGTPQQIIDKYTQLHRDALLSGDRVDAENFAQHAEHYLRMLAEAQREIDAKREQQEEQNRQRQAERDREREERLKAQEEASNGEADADAGPIETPEDKPKRRPRTRKPKADPQPQPSDGGGDEVSSTGDAPSEAAE